MWRITGSVPGVDGVRLVLRIPHRRSADTGATLVGDTIEWYTPRDLEEQFEADDITGQRRLDGSVVLVNGNRTQILLGAVRSISLSEATGPRAAAIFAGRLGGCPRNPASRCAVTTTCLVLGVVTVRRHGDDAPDPPGNASFPIHRRIIPLLQWTSTLAQSTAMRSRNCRETDAMQVTQIQDAAELIQMEYAEMPGLQLTFWQAQRLWNLSEDLCDNALSTLTRSGFLVRTRDGRYRRPHPERPAADSTASLLRANPA